MVTVTAADDDNHASGEEAVFAHSVSSGGDYKRTPALAIDSVIAATVDTDSPNVLISVSGLDFEEGEDDEYDIRLTTDPQATVTVTSRSKTPTEITRATSQFLPRQSSLRRRIGI